jgi:hypothetical protein
MTSSSIRFDVQQLIFKYWNALDRRDYPKLLSLLTDDVDWRLSSNRSGRQAVAEALDERAPNLVVRHLIDNLVVEDSEDGYEAVFVLTAFAHFAGPAEAGPYPTAPPGVLCDITASVASTPEGLRIRRMVSSDVFRTPPK